MSPDYADIAAGQSLDFGALPPRNRMYSLVDLEATVFYKSPTILLG